jgi:hypothetical protein
MARLTVDGEYEEKTIANHHYDTMCACGHRHAEHSAFGSCHGCAGCDEDDDLEAEHDHAYERCTCTDFQVVYTDDIAATA